jgi:hypothetical protein
MENSTKEVESAFPWLSELLSILQNSPVVGTLVVIGGTVMAALFFAGKLSAALLKIIEMIKLLRRSKTEQAENGDTSVVRNARWDPPIGDVSRFAANASDVELVLDIRREEFGNNPVCPDRAYRIGHQKNQRLFKLVYDDQEAIGYWSVVPVSRDNYQQILSGDFTHETVITEMCLDWTEVDTANVYLYLVGIVRRPDKNDRLNRINSAHTMLDVFNTMNVLHKNCTIKGACGYPATISGQRMMEQRLMRHGFKGTGIFLDPGESRWELVCINEEEIENFFRSTEIWLSRTKCPAPEWDNADRVQLLTDLRRINR